MLAKRATLYQRRHLPVHHRRAPGGSGGGDALCQCLSRGRLSWDQIALLFVGAMVCLSAAFIAFLIEVRVAVRALRIGLDNA